jgi:ubiquinone/menaquinone biosynthesis C-methylase UbiE
LFSGRTRTAPEGTADAAGVSGAAAKDFRHITYQTFGIDPAQFYAGKFAGQLCTVDFLATPNLRYSIEYGRARFLAAQVAGARALDIGCGSGPYAHTLRRNTGVRELIGIDLDPACVEIARQVYDDALPFDLGQKLPFPDRHFDTVFSCDLFGHIEFRHKDRLIAEIARVTKPGGRSVHIIESAPFDYDTLTDAPDDPVRTYVRAEGHVGIEDAASLQARWGRRFASVTIENAMIWPFSTIYGYVFDVETPPEVKAIMQAFSAAEREAAHVALGYACERMIDWIRRSDPGLLVPGDGNPVRRASGLVNLVATTPRPPTA